ncbi:rCG43353 [Rattus norvegicus]|uniref:RCG43353 n=1 Tax=Rattus norvegicus TaxID=10116 RepID=A6IWT7_RAT|nr:rCG43353 [Rattus norvegicus]
MWWRTDSAEVLPFSYWIRSQISFVKILPPLDPPREIILLGFNFAWEF